MSNPTNQQLGTTVSIPAYNYPAPRSSRSQTIWILVLVASLVTALALLALQYRQTTKAVNAKDEYKSALAQSRKDLTETEADLKASRTQVTGALNEVEHYRTIADDKVTQLDACALVVEVADHEQNMALLAMQASSDSTNSYYGAALTKYNRIETHLDAVQVILDDNGYSDTGDLYEACDPETMVS